LGGVVFASQMGQTRAFDSDPKRWRMVSAMALDCATLLEILSPLVAVSLVLPIASVANIGKNIGFLTASASRAALHQSLAIAGNLGDVTAKAGSQAIMASLIGTSVGIGLSSLLQHDTLNFALGFLGLSIIHQGSNYLSLQYVPLAHFNTQRLSIVLEEYLATTTVLSPVEVSKRESFFPLSSASDRLTKEWLQVGRPLQQACPDPRRLDTLLKGKPKEYSYLISLLNDDGCDDDENTTVDVIYFENATGEDVICGLYHAWLIRRSLLLLEAESSEEATKSTTTESDNSNSNTAMDELLQSTYQQVEMTFPNLVQELQHQGWKTALEVTTIESSSSVRINTYDL
jgi:Vitamin B6 photo-protection and homoeostasis